MNEAYEKMIKAEKKMKETKGGGHNMKAKLVYIENGRWVVTETTIEYLERFAVGYTEDLSERRRKDKENPFLHGGCYHREELDNLPILKGFLGPMWDGDCPRYETQEVYNQLSI